MSDTTKDAIAKILDIGKKVDEIIQQFAKTRGVLAFEALIRAVNNEVVDIRQVREPQYWL